MEEVIDPLRLTSALVFMEVCLCLCQLILMVWKGQIDSSCVDVHLRVEDAAGHC